MGEGRKREYREILYPVGGAIVLSLILAGFVYKPRVELTVRDYEASLAIDIDMGNFDAARRDIQIILEKDPGNLYALLIKAHLSLTEESDIEEAVSLYKRSLPHAAGHPQIEADIYDSIALLSLRTGKYQDAKFFAEKRMSLHGEIYISKFIIALSCLLLDDDKGYEENLSKALNMGVISPALRYRLKDLLGDEEDLQRVYFQGFKYRANYEHRCDKTQGM